MIDGRSYRRPPWTAVTAIVLMAVHCVGLLSVQLLSSSNCGGHNNDCDGMGVVDDMLTTDAFAGVMLNGIIVFGLAYGHRWARICAMAYYGVVTVIGLLIWSTALETLVMALAGVVWPVSIIVLLVCRPARRWTTAALDGPRCETG